MLSNRRWTKAIIIGLVLVFSASLLTGCNSSNQPKKLTLWVEKSYEQVANDTIQKIANDFAAANKVEVEVVFVPWSDIPTKLAAAVEGKALPGLSLIESPSEMRNLQEAGLLADLTDVQKNFGNPLPVVEQVGKVDGKWYLISPSVVVVPMQYRKDYLDQAGVTKLPTTWEEFYEVSKQVTKKPTRYGLALSMGSSTDPEGMLRPILWSYGMKEFTEDGKTATINSPETIEGLKFIQKLYKDTIPPGATGWDLSGDNKSYQSGETTFNMNLGTILTNAKKNDPALFENTQVMVMPAGPAGTFTYDGVNAWVVFKGPEEQLAKDFLKFFSQKENFEPYLKAFGGYYMSPYDKYLPADDPFWKEDPRRQAFAENAKYGHEKGWPAAPSAAINEILNRQLLTQMVQRVLVENWTPEKAAEQAQKDYQEVLDSYSK